MSATVQGFDQSDSVMDQTTGPVAREARVSEQIVRLYADQGLVPCIRTPAGGRLFRRDAPQKVREVFESRMRLRGRVRA